MPPDNSNNTNTTNNISADTVSVTNPAQIAEDKVYAAEAGDLYWNRRALAWCGFVAIIAIDIMTMFFLSPERIAAITPILISAHYTLTGVIFAYISAVTLTEIMGRKKDAS